MIQIKNYFTLFLLSFASPYFCCGQNSPKQPVEIHKLIDSLDASLKDHYVFPEKAKIIAAYLQAQLNGNAYTPFLNNPQQLAEQIQAGIYKAHRDPHMRVEYNPGFVPRENNKPSAEEIIQSKKYWKENNYIFKKLEVLQGNIGYFPFNGFVDDIKAAKPTIAAALQFLSNTSAIIIDLRENWGGSPEMVSQVESYFFKEKTHMNDLINRSAKDTVFYYADPAKTGGLTLSMPVYILTSHNTFSGAEDFSYGMQQAKRAIIVGEVTGGGAHPQMPFSIGQGFVVSIPFARSLNPVTHTDWEGTGVIPDVKVAADKAFIKAQEVIFSEQQSAATNEQEKRRLQYYMNALHVNDNATPLPSPILDQYTGTYGPLVIYRDKNKLFCKNTDSNNYVSELKQISKDLFVLDDNAQVEFVKDSKGIYATTKLYISDGNVFEEHRKETK